MKRHLIEIVIQMALCILFRDAPSIRVSGPGLSADLLDQAGRRRAPGARWEVGVAGTKANYPSAEQSDARAGRGCDGRGRRAAGMRG